MRERPWLARPYAKLALQVKKQNKKVRNDNKLTERQIRSQHQHSVTANAHAMIMGLTETKTAEIQVG